jgi:hypothetical protein
LTVAKPRLCTNSRFRTRDCRCRRRPRRRRARHDLILAPVTLLAEGLFSHCFAEWITEYNTVRMHGELGGQTPLARWCEDATPLREVPAEALRWMLMADVERTVNKDGVHFERVRFIAPELNGLVGDRVQVRYTPHDLRRIEIFRGDQWLCSAYPQDELTPEQRSAVLERRHADAAELGRRQRRASRRARARLAPITAPGPGEDTTVITTVITTEQARQERQERRGRDDDGRARCGGWAAPICSGCTATSTTGTQPARHLMRRSRKRRRPTPDGWQTARTRSRRRRSSRDGAALLGCRGRGHVAHLSRC